MSLLKNGSAMVRGATGYERVAALMLGQPAGGREPGLQRWLFSRRLYYVLGGLAAPVVAASVERLARVMRRVATGSTASASWLSSWLAASR